MPDDRPRPETGHGRDRGRPPAAGRERAQTGIDFLVGLTVFLLTVGVVFGLVGEMVDPFADDQEAPLVADHAASRLSMSVLANDSQPGVLNETCTYAVFDGATVADCPTDGSDPLATQVGLTSGDGLNVTIRQNVTGDSGLEVLCHTADAVTDCSSGGSPLSVGPPVPPGESTVVASRTVALDGRDVLLVVRAW